MFQENSLIRKTSSFNNKFEFIRSIALKSPKEFPIVEVNKLYLHKDHFFIFDKKYATLSAFDSTGNYLYSIGKIGEGEGEFMDLSDVAFDKKREVFLLFLTEAMLCTPLLPRENS